MIYPDTDAKAFSLKHGVPIKDSMCLKCKTFYLIDIPIITKDLVGFTQKDHGCGESYVQTVFTPREGSELFKAFRDI